ncbi:MAG: hypothetical protein U1C74_23030 [Phenylobacterium sp.]|nr:hypothetical protein [Phenylobacterium sp.]
MEHGRRASLALLAGLAAAPVAAGAGAATAADRKGKGAPLPPVTIYHLEGRRSERLV